ncbi:unnamed protein product [Malus baccata var. baccata]
MQSKEGVLQRLNGICRFYELAVMQLEGCLKFVRQETDSWRLKESELAIKANDLELALLRESSMSVMLERRTRSEPVEEYILDNRLSRDDDEDDGDGDDRDNEFLCELKNSVDQQVLNIRQKLEPDYEDKEGNPEVVEGVNNKRIEQMGSDMSILKKTLDLAFGKMQKHFDPHVQRVHFEQWRCSFEKETMSILLKGFMTDFQEKENQVSLGLKEYWSDLMNEVANLRLKSVDSLQTSVGGKKYSPEEYSHGNSEKQRSLKAKELMQELHEEVNKDEGGHYVSKMIKNHESIIRKKSAEAEELNMLRREILRQKLNLSSRREDMGMQENSLKEKVQKFILRLDKLGEWDAKLGETFDNCKFRHKEETLLDHRFLKSDASRDKNLELDTLEDGWEKMDKIPYEELQNERMKAELEQEEEDLRAVIMEKTYVALLLTEVVNQWKENIGSVRNKSRTREDIYCTVIREGIKDYGSNGKITLAQLEDVRWTLLQGMCKEWNECIDSYETESHIRQELERHTTSETVKGVVKTASDELDQYQDTVTTQFIRRKFYQGGCLYGFHQRNHEGCHYQEPSYCQPKPHEEVQLNSSVSLSPPALRFSQITSIEKRKSIHRDTFTRRCHDLWKAETGVDLLGDQVADVVRLIKAELTGVVNASKI